MEREQGSKVRKKKSAKLYYLLLVPAIALGLLVIPWITSASQNAIDIKSFPEFIPDEQSVIEEGMALSADNYLPLATTEVECGQKLDLASLPDTIMAEILVETKSENGGTAFTADIADIAAEWDSSELDINTPGTYKLSLKLPGDYKYEGVLPYVAVEVKQEEKEPAGQQEDETGVESETTNGEGPVSTTGPETQESPNEEKPQPAETAPEATDVQPDENNQANGAEEGEEATNPCNHNEGCKVECEDKDDCQHTCDKTCGGIASNEIEQFCGIYPNGSVSARYYVELGESFSMQDFTSAYMTDGSVVNIPVKWAGNYNLNAVGTYKITMQVQGGYIWNGPKVVAEILVYENDNDESGR